MEAQSFKPTLSGIGVSEKNAISYQGQEMVNAEGLLEMLSIADTPKARQIDQEFQKAYLALRTDNPLLSERCITNQALAIALKAAGISTIPM